MADDNVVSISPLTGYTGQAGDRTGATNPAAVANTTALALELARALRAVRVTTVQLEAGLSDATWVAAARVVEAERRARRTAAGEVVSRNQKRTRVPSESTKAAVLAVFHDQDTHPDPFDGFPT